MKTCCFSGHRDIPASDLQIVRERLKNEVLERIAEGFLYFGTGGARGFDTEASEVVLEVKKTHPEIHLILVLPFQDQYRHERGWTRREIEKYHELQRAASKVRVLSDGYSSGVYYRRNRHLIDNSSVCIAYQTHGNSGTSYTTNYARTRNVRVVNIAENL